MNKLPFRRTRTVTKLYLCTLAISSILSFQQANAWIVWEEGEPGTNTDAPPEDGYAAYSFASTMISASYATANDGYTWSEAGGTETQATTGYSKLYVKTYNPTPAPTCSAPDTIWAEAEGGAGAYVYLDSESTTWFTYGSTYGYGWATVSVDIDDNCSESTSSYHSGSHPAEAEGNGHESSGWSVSGGISINGASVSIGDSGEGTVGGDGGNSSATWSGYLRALGAFVKVSHSSKSKAWIADDALDAYGNSGSGVTSYALHDWEYPED
ncbi:MAG: hypothetical protein JNK74_15925 [Candidatus Hydrogenedentes bacterium]|nr:hypothetical protein [Candidatus Hydrogenedentota bacterium]